jgi:hypothetical protein
MTRPRIEAADLQQVANVVIEGLAAGKPVEIDGLAGVYWECKE